MTDVGMPAGVELGAIGDAVIFENEAIRVWRLELAPKGIQPWHQHHLPYLIVPLTAGENIMRFADGRVRETHEIAGEVIWREAGIPHQLENAHGSTYRNVLIEFKQPPKTG
jgi:quercetin dioxygenase-like cupin family protein